MGCTSSTPKPNNPVAGPTATNEATNQDAVEKTIAKIGAHLPSPAEAKSNLYGALRSVMGANKEALDNAIISINDGKDMKSANQAVKELNLPVVGVFPAETPLGIATLKALTRGEARGACAKIICIVTDDTKISEVRKALGGKAVTNAMAFAIAEFSDLQSMTAAFLGLDRLFLMPAESASRSSRTRDAVDCACQVGVHHIVFQSRLYAHSESHLRAKALHEVEVKIAALVPPVPYTFLRAPTFLEDIVAVSFNADKGTLMDTTANTPFFTLTMNDYARCVASVLAKPTIHTEHHNRVFELCMPQLVTMSDIQKELSKATKAELVNVTPAEMKQDMLSRAFPEWFADEIVSAAEHARIRKDPVIPGDIAHFIPASQITTTESLFQANRFKYQKKESPLMCVWPAEGLVGQAALKALLIQEGASPARVRAVVVSAEAKAELESQYAGKSNFEAVVVADITNGQAALNGVDRLLLIPNESDPALAATETVIAQTKEAAVAHVCLISIHTALLTTAIGTRFAALEKLVAAGGLSYTVIRTSPKMDLIFQFAKDVKAEGHKVHHWLSTGVFFPVDPSDVGKAGAAAIIEGPLMYGNRTFLLQGPQQGTFNDMCGELSNVLGFHVEPVADIDTFIKQKERLQGSYPDAVLEDVILLHEQIGRMNDQTVTTDLYQLIGPRSTLKQFLTKYKSKFA